MLTAVKGTYDNGQIIWDEVPPVHERMKVVVTFLEKDTEVNLVGEKGIRFGSLIGKVSIPSDFNEPLDDLNEYM